MDAESSSITVEQIVNFLKETGGKVTNADLSAFGRLSQRNRRRRRPPGSSLKPA